MVEINLKQSVKGIEEDLLQKFRDIAREAGRVEGYDSGEISVALVDNPDIRNLNKKYRDVDESTDVLSFPMDDELWGDIIISVEKAEEQAEEYGHSLEREICYLFTHGLFHILGYDHKSPGEKEEMRQKEERILGEFGILRDQEG